MKTTTTLFRPINDKELALIKDLQFAGFPPRLPEQPFFYPVMNEAYATQITKEWNVPTYGVGYVVKFEVNANYLSQFKVQNVGAEIHDELWVPAEKMEEFNSNIIGEIEVISEFN